MTLVTGGGLPLQHGHRTRRAGHHRQPSAGGANRAPPARPDSRSWRACRPGHVPAAYKVPAASMPSAASIQYTGGCLCGRRRAVPPPDWTSSGRHTPRTSISHGDRPTSSRSRAVRDQAGRPGNSIPGAVGKAVTGYSAFRLATTPEAPHICWQSGRCRPSPATAPPICSSYDRRGILSGRTLTCGGADGNW